MSRMVIICAWLVVMLITANTSPAHAQGDSYYSGSDIVNTPATINKTQLHFYMHNTLSDNSVVLTAKPDGTVVEQGNVVPFGSFYVFDDLLTVGPDASTSEIIGNSRGMYPSISRGTDMTLLLCADLEFTSGEFNGSALSVFSRDPLVVEKEVSIVGGKGKFRMAKGYILIRVVYFNATNGDSIVECNATIYHLATTVTVERKKQSAWMEFITALW